VTVTAPPWPPDSVEWAEPEALIAEARQRARRRRHIYAAAIAVLALLATSTTTAPRRRDTRSFWHIDVPMLSGSRREHWMVRSDWPR
jgi:hypothetical protein